MRYGVDGVVDGFVGDLYVGGLCVVMGVYEV